MNRKQRRMAARQGLASDPTARAEARFAEQMITAPTAEDPVLPEPIFPEPIFPKPGLPESIFPQATLPEAIFPEPSLPEAIFPVAAEQFVLQPAPMAPAGIEPLFVSGRTHHQLGRIAAAEETYRTILSTAPAHVPTLYCFGLLAYETGRPDQAIELLSRAVAIDGQAEFHNDLGRAFEAAGRPADAKEHYARAATLKPDFAYPLNNLATILKNEGRFEEAAASYQAALALNPAYPEAHYNLGTVRHSQGRGEEAIEHYHQAIALNPDFAEPHYNLGTIRQSQGRPAEAVALYEHVLTLQPGNAEAHYNLATIFKSEGRLDEAMARYQQVLALQPDFARAHFNLAWVQQSQGKSEDAVASYARTIDIEPHHLDAINNLGTVLQGLRRLDEAAHYYERAVAIDAGFSRALYNLGTVRQGQGRLQEALTYFEQAVDASPDMIDALSNLGTVLLGQGRHDEALARFQQALDINPQEARVHSNLLMNLHYSADASNTDILAAARRFGAKFDAPPDRARFPNGRDPARRLRIGYVSADFQSHPVGYFLACALPDRDRAPVEVFCYANSKSADALTDRLRAAADHWRSIASLGDTDAATLIHQDGIDILVDLSGHTANNRLPLFALKPAPIQVTWAGYVGTTGLAAMDYILADRYVVPTGDEAFYVEKVCRLPDSYVCFAPPEPAIEIGTLPVMSAVGVTFGCFNNRTKITRETVALWSAVLARVAGSRLLLKTKNLGDSFTCETLLAQFAGHGIAADRLILEGHAPRAELLAAYNRVDIGLDPTPYGGGLTTMESLWMGVPVVCLRAPRWVARAGDSILSTLGLPELVADTVDEYVSVAAALAEDPRRLASLRATLRARLEASPLCDGQGFSRNLAAAYREMWQAWCDEQAVPDDLPQKNAGTGN
ncbi:MAG TPA: tetratricopeptide repeat protein [Stellaceae bacterium]|nr:tetratricopeptide repeat protein [Stellaceae bacterium]